MVRRIAKKAMEGRLLAKDLREDNLLGAHEVRQPCGRVTHPPRYDADGQPVFMVCDKPYLANQPGEDRRALDVVEREEARKIFWFGCWSALVGALAGGFLTWMALEVGK